MADAAMAPWWASRHAACSGGTQQHARADEYGRAVNLQVWSPRRSWGMGRGQLVPTELCDVCRSVCHERSRSAPHSLVKVYHQHTQVRATRRQPQQHVVPIQRMVVRISVGSNMRAGKSKLGLPAVTAGRQEGSWLCTWLKDQQLRHSGCGRYVHACTHGATRANGLLITCFAWLGAWAFARRACLRTAFHSLVGALGNVPQQEPAALACIM